MADALYDLKEYSNMPGQGYTEKIERAFKGITREVGVMETSNTLEKTASKLANFLEYHGVANIVRKKDVSFAEGMSKHMFFVDDKIVNAVILLGGAASVAVNGALLLPFIAIGVFYFVSDHFIRTIQKL